MTVQTPNGTATTSGLFVSNFTAGLATITVNSAADTNAADSVVTLSEAILVANGSLGRALTAGEQAQVSGTPTASSLDEIRFLIGSGAQSINVGSAGLGSLPDIANYSAFLFTQWGQLGDVPVMADFDGDGKADLGFYRDGLWGVLKSTTGYSTASPLFVSWGGAGLQPIVGDFDGDGKADIGYMVPPGGGQSAAYAIVKSSLNYGFGPGQPLFISAGFPSLGDTPVVGDYDGDGKADAGIWRESQGVWIIAKSTGNYGSFLFTQWGQPGDIALPNSSGKHQ